MNWKENYTKIFLKTANKSIDEATVKQHITIWWQNTRSKDIGGLRLTESGYKFITEELELQTYQVP